MRKYLKFILLGLFTIFILWFFGRNLDWAEVWESLQKANITYLVLAALIICLGYILRAKRWQVLLEPITETSLKELFAATTVGFAAMFFVGRAGEIVRPMWLPMRDPRVRPSAALATVGVERLFDFASLICFFAVNSFWLKGNESQEAQFFWVKVIAALLLVGVIAGFVALYLFQRHSEAIIKWCNRYSIFRNRVGSIVLNLFHQLATSLDVLRDWREIVQVIFWTFLLWLAISIPTWLVILAFGIDMGFSQSIFVMWWAAIGSLVPTPGGGAGAFHAATAGGLIVLGVDRDLAAAVSIVMGLIYFFPAVFFGIYYFFHGDISIAKIRSLLSTSNAVEEIESEAPDAEPVTE